ncbi:MAG: hypothetical protein GC164_03790 [Phycisphaera sp.]|nr:hypothetical protein [Phycisphaera sp.]
MARKLTESDAHRLTHGFADGELDAQDQLDMLAHMSDHPKTTRQVMHQQQLKQSVSRAMASDTPLLSDLLRKRIGDLARSETRQIVAPPTTHDAPPILARINRWLPVALAAVLVLGASILYTASRQPSVNHDVAGLKVLSATMVDRFTKRHDSCSRKLAELAHQTKFPERLEELPSALAQHFNTQQGPPTLDLSAIGYEFSEVGDCSIPGKDSVHLIYRPVGEKDLQHAMSLWIGQWRGDDSVKPDTLFRAVGDQGQPMLIWRHGSLAYYLVADDPDRLDSAAHALGAN